MSREIALSFSKKIASDAELRQQIQGAGDINNILKIAASAGYGFSAEDWQAVVNTSSELSDADLGKISGGGASIVVDEDLKSTKKV